MAVTGLDRHLLDARIDALYLKDPRGRLLRTNEWDGRPAPRFHLMRTASGPIVRFGPDLPDALVRDLKTLAGQEAWDPAAGPLPRRHDRFLALLSAHRPVERTWSGPAYLCQGAAPETETVIVSEANAHLLARRFESWAGDVPHRRPFVAVVEDGEAVALCASVRISERVHCAGVETHPDHRRKGHARAAVAGWSRAVRALGAAPFYSTSWDNLASQAVAASLGMSLAGADFHVT